MKIYTAKQAVSDTRRSLVADDMILTRTMPTAAGSRMLEGYESLFDAEAVTRLEKAGYGFAGKVDVGEFAIDLVGESSCHGAVTRDGRLVSATAAVLCAEEAYAALNLDVNGSVRRAAAQSGLVSVKPTYGTVSRYGTVPVACSGECVSVTARSAAACREILSVIAGHDDKDGTSLSEDACRLAQRADQPIRRVLFLRAFAEERAEPAVAERLDDVAAVLRRAGIEICEGTLEGMEEIARVAWNILMSAELCNNVSRYDGVKYGYRAASFSGIDELYTNSRTEAFGELLKTAILFGSHALSSENYDAVYDKALRVRRVVAEALRSSDADAILLPAASRMAYTEQDLLENPHLAFEENVFTALASLTGLPVAVFGGVQLMGNAFSEGALLDVAALYEKEAR